MSKSTRKTVLVLAANPTDTPHVRLDQEVRDVKEGVKLVPPRVKLDFIQKQAVRLKDIHRAMLENPHVVHFCGHGAQSGIVVEDDSGKSTVVDPGALSELFQLYEHQVECVLLNACYTLPQATAIHRYIKHVIGMSKEIGDKAAIAFSVGFYQALAGGEPVERAYLFGRNAINIFKLPGHLTPVLLTRTSANPRELIECIRRQQREHVRESYGERAHECFTDDDLDAFEQGRVTDGIIRNLEQDPGFGDIILATKTMTPSDQAALLRAASETYKPTWAELGRISPEGQTEAGQRAERMIANAICDLAKQRLK